MGDRVAVVTGAAGTIGRELTRAFAEAGYRVAHLDLASTLPHDADDRWVAVDVTDVASVDASVAAVLERFGRIDVLVNNAGVTAIGSFEDTSPQTHRHVMAVNYHGPVDLTRAALPALRSTRGRVVVMSSVAGFAPVVGRPAYVGSKHAVTGVFNALRAELAHDGIGVTVVHPQFVRSHVTDAGGREDRSTTGELLEPADVAEAIVSAVLRGRDRVVLGRTAKLAWVTSRLAPRLYERIMTRRLRDLDRSEEST